MFRLTVFQLEALDALSDIVIPELNHALSDVFNVHVLSLIPCLILPNVFEWAYPISAHPRSVPTKAAEVAHF